MKRGKLEKECGKKGNYKKKKVGNYHPKVLFRNKEGSKEYKVFFII